ncbi:hypothetical protein BYT27DRAFT_7259218 [Phlegmacium glaucopus]|nr:hypothetical protein BYT27DRAFT_7259218 [Phlegmacium glaucopus]
MTESSQTEAEYDTIQFPPHADQDSTSQSPSPEDDLLPASSTTSVGPQAMPEGSQSPTIQIDKDIASIQRQLTPSPHDIPQHEPSTLSGTPTGPFAASPSLSYVSSPHHSAPPSLLGSHAQTPGIPLTPTAR